MTTDLIIRLAHELSCALEIGFTPDEIASPVWEDAVDALIETRHFLVGNSLAVPEPLETVLAMAKNEAALAS